MITGINLGAQESDVTSVQIGTGSSDMVACEVTGYVPGIRLVLVQQLITVLAFIQESILAQCLSVKYQ